MLAEATPAVVNSALRVAFVEDNDDFRMLGCGANCSPCSATSWKRLPMPSQRCRRLRPGRFDVLLTDVGLPGLSGLALAERARGIDPALHVVIASGYGESVKASGGTPFPVLTKPFTIDQLAQCLLR